MVEVRTSWGSDDFIGDAVVPGRAKGVIGTPGLCSLFTVANEGLNAGVCGEGAANDTWEVFEVE